MVRGRVITQSDLELAAPLLDTATVSLREAREEAERRTIIAALERSQGNISRAASAIRVSRPTLHGLLAKHNLQRADFKKS